MTSHKNYREQYELISTIKKYTETCESSLYWAIKQLEYANMVNDHCKFNPVIGDELNNALDYICDAQINARKHLEKALEAINQERERIGEETWPTTSNTI